MIRVINKTLASIKYKNKTIKNFIYVDSMDDELSNLIAQKLIKIEYVKDDFDRQESKKIKELVELESKNNEEKIEEKDVKKKKKHKEV